jgi:hypothetical protein
MNYCLGINQLLEHWSRLRNKYKLDALFFLSFPIIYALHVSNRVTKHNQEAVTVYGAYGI